MSPSGGAARQDPARASGVGGAVDILERVLFKGHCRKYPGREVWCQVSPGRGRAWNRKYTVSQPPASLGRPGVGPSMAFLLAGSWGSHSSDFPSLQVWDHREPEGPLSRARCQFSFRQCWWEISLHFTAPRVPGEREEHGPCEVRGHRGSWSNSTHVASSCGHLQ